jgi:hypothetical protein
VELVICIHHASVPLPPTPYPHPPSPGERRLASVGGRRAENDQQPAILNPLLSTIFLAPGMIAGDLAT